MKPIVTSLFFLLQAVIEWFDIRLCGKRFVLCVLCAHKTICQCVVQRSLALTELLTSRLIKLVSALTGFGSPYIQLFGKFNLVAQDYDGVQTHCKS